MPHGGGWGLAAAEAPDGAQLGIQRRLKGAQNDVLQILVGHAALLCEGRAQRAMFMSVCQHQSRQTDSNVETPEAASSDAAHAGSKDPAYVCHSSELRSSCTASPLPWSRSRLTGRHGSHRSSDCNGG